MIEHETLRGHVFAVGRALGSGEKLGEEEEACAKRVLGKHGLRVVGGRVAQLQDGVEKTLGEKRKERGVANEVDGKIGHGEGG